MPALSINVPFPVFQDRDGQPLDNGYVYIGTPYLDPQTNPVQVYFDDALTIPAAQPLRTINGYVSNAGTPAQLYVNGVNFSIKVLDSKANLVYSFPDGSGISPNASGIQYDPAGVGAVSTTVQAKLRETVSVRDFGAIGDGVTDDTAAIQAAIDAVFNAGGGTVHIPTGTYIVSSIVKNWTGAVTVNIRGDGKRATTVKKKTGTSTPVFDFSADVSVLDVYSSISDLRIQGNTKANHGLRLTRWARFDLQRVFIDSCDVAIENLGSLVFSIYDVTVQGNNIGYRSRISGSIRCNLVQFFGGQISANTSFGMDIGDASGVRLIGTDLSANGTVGDTATGGILLRSTMDDETGYSSFSFTGGWMESNYGWAFRTENASGLLTDINGVVFAGNEAGRSISIGNIFSSQLSSVVAGSVSDTAQIAAARSTVMNSVIGVLTDTSTRYRHINVGTTIEQIADTFSGAAVERTKLASLDFIFGRSDQISGGTNNSIDYYLYGTGEQRFLVNGTRPLTIGNNAIGFYGTTPIAKPSVTGAKGGNAALSSLLTQLAALGLITDSTT